MNYTPGKVDKLYATYTRMYRARRMVNNDMTDMYGRDEFFKRYLDIKEREGTHNITQKIVYSHIKTSQNA